MQTNKYKMHYKFFFFFTYNFSFSTCVNYVFHLSNNAPGNSIFFQQIFFFIEFTFISIQFHGPINNFIMNKFVYNLEIKFYNKTNMRLIMNL